MIMWNDGEYDLRSDERVFECVLVWSGAAEMDNKC